MATDRSRSPLPTLGMIPPIIQRHPQLRRTIRVQKRLRAHMREPILTRPIHSPVDVPETLSVPDILPENRDQRTGTTGFRRFGNQGPWVYYPLTLDVKTRLRINSNSKLCEVATAGDLFVDENLIDRAEHIMYQEFQYSWHLLTLWPSSQSFS